MRFLLEKMKEQETLWMLQRKAGFVQSKNGVVCVIHNPFHTRREANTTPCIYLDVR